MAPAVAVDTWGGRHVRVSDVVNALSDLRLSSTERSVSRTAVMTLVVVARTDEQAYTAKTVVHELGTHHPARIVVLRPDPDHAASLDAQATLFNAEADGHPVNFEEITLSVGGQAALHLDSLVEAFTLADLPIVVWYPGTLPEPTEALLSLATAVVVDSRDTGDASSIRGLLELVRRRTVVDLSWVRLQPWRDLLAGLFDPPPVRAFVTGVASATVKGKPGPRHLLGGWLLAQLGLDRRNLTLADARHVEMRLECHLDGEIGTFEVGRIEGQRVVWAAATVPTVPSHRQLLALPDDSLAASLSAGLTHLQPDRVWERALSAAASLAV